MVRPAAGGRGGVRGRKCPLAIGISETHVACHVCQMWHATFNCRTTTEAASTTTGQTGNKTEP